MQLTLQINLDILNLRTGSINYPIVDLSARFDRRLN